MFGDRLKARRLLYGQTQQSMVDLIIETLIQNGYSPEEASVSISTYRNWEQNVAIPNSKYLRVIAPLLETTTDYLLGLSDDPDDPSLKNQPEIKHVVQTMRKLSSVGQQRVAVYADDLKMSGNYDRVYVINVSDTKDANNIDNVIELPEIKERPYKHAAYGRDLSTLTEEELYQLERTVAERRRIMAEKEDKRRNKKD